MVHKYLALDPGTHSIGFAAAIFHRKKEWEFVTSGVFKVAKSINNHYDRIEILLPKVMDLHKQLKISTTLMEDVSKGWYPTGETGFVLGAVDYALQASLRDIVRYSPMTVKSTVSGNGKAGKDIVRQIAEKFWGSENIGHTVTDHNEGDALGILMTHRVFMECSK